MLAHCYSCSTRSRVLSIYLSFIFLIILLVFLMNLFCRDLRRSIAPVPPPHVVCFVLAQILPVLYFVRSTVTESVLWSSSKLGNYTLSAVSRWLLNIFAAVPCDWNPLSLSEPETRCIAVVTAALLWRLQRFVVFYCNMAVSQVCPDLRLGTTHLGVLIP